jgi:hypothetical protein
VTVSELVVARPSAFVVHGIDHTGGRDMPGKLTHDEAAKLLAAAIRDKADELADRLDDEDRAFFDTDVADALAGLEGEWEGDDE